jgi:putative hydrolase of HD superfamily
LNHEIALPVQKQLEAYNDRDIDAFMIWWADDCQYYAFPELAPSGWTGIDRTYERVAG